MLVDEDDSDIGAGGECLEGLLDDRDLRIGLHNEEILPVRSAVTHSSEDESSDCILVPNHRNQLARLIHFRCFEGKKK